MKARLLARQWAQHCQGHKPRSPWSSSLPVRSFSRSIQRRDEPAEEGGPIKAAPPIDFDAMDAEAAEYMRKMEEEEAQLTDPATEAPTQSASEAGQRMKFARIVPASPSYFTAKPHFVDASLELQRLYRKYVTLPTVNASAAPRASWKKLADFRNSVGEPVKASKYKGIVELLKRLNRIHPDTMPEEVASVLDKHRRDINPHAVTRHVAIPDEFGRAYGLGRRKSSSARAWLVQGQGEVLINGEAINNVFGRVHDRESALWALKVTSRLDKYNVWALTRGGGTTGQAEAITFAVAKALLVHEPALKAALRRAGCITTDPRRVERKKPGRLKARKKPAWVKR